MLGLRFEPWPCDPRTLAPSISVSVVRRHLCENHLDGLLEHRPVGLPREFGIQYRSKPEILLLTNSQVTPCGCWLGVRTLRNPQTALHFFLA